MSTETKTEKKTLTPAQFRALRALARKHGHAWGTVPDGNYDLDAIHQWGYDHSWEYGGVLEPSTFERHGDLVGCHTTKTGRTSWEVQADGNVLIEIYRPTAETKAWDLLSKEYQGTETPKPECVFRVELINEDNDIFDIQDDGAEIVIHTNIFDTEQKKMAGWQSYIDNVSWQRDNEVHNHNLAERHLYAAMRCIVELLAIDVERPQGYLPEEEYQVWRQMHIAPIVEVVCGWLAPLFEVAAPDPLATEYIRRDPQDRPVRQEEENTQSLPETFWHRPAVTGYNTEADRYPIFISHKGEEYPMESEATAVQAVLLLRKEPSLPLIEAVKKAITR